MPNDFNKRLESDYKWNNIPNKKVTKGGFIAQDNSYPDSFWVEENSYIDAKIIGKCYIKENSVISKATIINSIISSNVIIYKSITIKKEIIGDNTKTINI